MTLRMEQVVAQLPDYIDAYVAGLPALNGLAERALDALDGWGRDPAAGDEQIRAAIGSKAIPYALSTDEAPGAVFEAPSPPDPVTVIATDGSSIEPDRFAAVPCFVVNTGYVVLPYGSSSIDADLHSIPALGPDAWDSDDADPGGDAAVGRRWGVNLERDVRELETGARLAAEHSASGTCVLLLDGTLLPWDPDSRQLSEHVRTVLASRAAEALDSLAALPATFTMGAYISASRSGDLSNSLAALAGLPLTGDLPGDGWLLSRTLGDGQRTSVFRAKSERIATVEQQKRFERHQVCFFYMRVGDDIARVEMPQWVAADPRRVEALVAVLMDQCSRCDGYPRALQEAHEQAVISSGDRAQFAWLLADMASNAGLRTLATGKAQSKRRRAL